ncbi:toll/interleukin-1 receptor domain-containing protein [Streptomyces sp. NPDC002566]|uniref:toll/interleukin-1 receptor domain-containing protein n=1 Tax=Streptomyces sp. NPDC002566 TaxID=3364650 RepID=UPI0036BF4060
MREAFISHSTRGDAFATTVLEKIAAGLRDANWTPLVDQEDLPPGDEWLPEVVDWLARCHAAVILLNDAALESHWVRREVNVLMWRRALGSPVYVVPVLLGVPSTGMVKKAGLEELRPIQFARVHNQSEQDADTLATRVLKRFAELPEPAPDDGPMTEWLERLEMRLSEVTRQGALSKAATELGLDHKHVAEVTRRQGGCLFLARQFLLAPPDKMEKALHVLAPALPQTALRGLIRDLATTWVDEEAARPTLPPPGRRPRNMTLLLNASRSGTAEHYIQRATCGATYGYEVESVGDLPTGEDRVGERVEDWENAVWEQFFGVVADEDRILPDDLDERTHYLVIDKALPPEPEFAQAVARLHRLFSWLIVMVTTGKSAPEAGACASFENPVLLEPLLTASTEATARARVGRLKKLPERLLHVD